MPILVRASAGGQRRASPAAIRCVVRGRRRTGGAGDLRKGATTRRVGAGELSPIMGEPLP